MHTTVPVIDIGPFLGGSPAKRAVAEEVGRACTDIGFFTIVGHGVPDSLVARMDLVSRAFFDLPLPEKLTVNRPKPEQSRGYIGVGDENLAYSLDHTGTTDLIVFFHRPNYDALIECLPSCCGPANPPRYAPVTSGQHRLTKFLKGVGAAPPPVASDDRLPAHTA